MCGAVGQSALMASYDMDTFRRFVLDSSFLFRFHVPQERLEAVPEGDTALLAAGLRLDPPVSLWAGPATRTGCREIALRAMGVKARVVN
jgi:hypothetical protein